jgi:maltose alpha-D-glucosyltransferase/alpha-amylase
MQFLAAAPEVYLLPLTFATGDRAFELRQSSPQAIVAQLKVKEKGRETEGVLYDGVYDSDFCKALLSAVARGRRYKDDGVELSAQPSKVFRKLLEGAAAPLEPTLLKREQSNTSVVYGDRMILKLFRRVTEGVSLELEVGRFLTEQAEFTHTPPLAGFFEMRKGRSLPATIGILQGLVAHECDAWRYTLDSLDHFFENILTHPQRLEQAALPAESVVELAEKEIPNSAQEVIGSYLPAVHLLGRRTGELHIALASDAKNPDFAPEPFTALYRRSLYQGMRTLADQSLALLRKRLKAMPEELRRDSEKVLELESAILGRFRQLNETKFSAMRIRCHGDYHLGQVLFTGKDFVILDFEGEPARSVSERRIKRSPLRDVAGMLRSFNYATIAKFKTDGVRPENLVQLKAWARYWNCWVSVNFLKGYLDAARQTAFLPKSRAEFALLMEIYLLEKAIYELGYELNNRPDWAEVPIEGILGLLEPK